MEYKIYRAIRSVYIPFIIRLFVSIILIIVAVPQIIIPFYPGSWVVWVFLCVIALLFFIPWRRVRHVIKFRKSFIFMLKNIFNKKILKHKFYDLITHMRMIFRERKEKRLEKKMLKIQKKLKETELKIKKLK